jgi:hypothetical protein
MYYALVLVGVFIACAFPQSAEVSPRRSLRSTFEGGVIEVVVGVRTFNNKSFAGFPVKDSLLKGQTLEKFTDQWQFDPDTQTGNPYPHQCVPVTQQPQKPQRPNNPNNKFGGQPLKGNATFYSTCLLCLAPLR